MIYGGSGYDTLYDSRNGFVVYNGGSGYNRLLLDTGRGATTVNMAIFGASTEGFAFTSYASIEDIDSAPPI